ncbi:MULTISPECIES: hypothetical protein [Bradyrhizobium]|uniref:hypothetical protein n=1 Tax=Bradyrhizobium elkanii TaxID=29448 RepID=UPI0004892697|nr:hypothetical protein [Bradyrhizobium elkanii]
MISLKSYCGFLSVIIGLTPDALYERQRVLVRAGALSNAVAGKGPGSGIRATPGNVSKLLLSVLASDTLSEIPTRTRELAGLKSVAGKCPITSEARFQKAFENLLSNRTQAESVLRIDVKRMSGTAQIMFKRSDAQVVASKFGADTERHTGMALQITATIPGWGIEAISQDMVDIAEGSPLSAHTPY